MAREQYSSILRCSKPRSCTHSIAGVGLKPTVRLQRDLTTSTTLYRLLVLRPCRHGGIRYWGSMMYCNTTYCQAFITTQTGKASNVSAAITARGLRRYSTTRHNPHATAASKNSAPATGSLAAACHLTPLCATRLTQLPLLHTRIFTLAGNHPAAPSSQTTRSTHPHTHSRMREHHHHSSSSCSTCAHTVHYLHVLYKVSPAVTGVWANSRVRVGAGVACRAHSGAGLR